MAVKRNDSTFVPGNIARRNQEFNCVCNSDVRVVESWVSFEVGVGWIDVLADLM